MSNSISSPNFAGQVFLERARYLLLTEYRTKLRLAVEAIPEETIWQRDNDRCNSVGNLLLHLAGNVRQWLISGVGGASDIRQRSTEFAAQSGTSGRELLAQLEWTLDEVAPILDGLSEAALLETRTIQGRNVTVLDAVFICVEHFSGHLGQIILTAKLRAPGAIQFYEDQGGLARPIWKQSRLEIRIDDLSDPRIAVFLSEHMQDMRATSPPESMHALDLESLKKPDITFWSAWRGTTLVGCGALKRLDAEHAELKSMRTSPLYRREGIGKQILEFILDEARRAGYRRMSLETGSQEFFEPARSLYSSYGFACGPAFADYIDDPNSVFMSREL